MSGFCSNVNFRDFIVLGPEQLETLRIPFRSTTEADNERCYKQVVRSKETKRLKTTAGIAEWDRSVNEMIKQMDINRKTKGLLTHDIEPDKLNYILFPCMKDRRAIWKRNG